VTWASHEVLDADTRDRVRVALFSSVAAAEIVGRAWSSLDVKKSGNSFSPHSVSLPPTRQSQLPDASAVGPYVPGLAHGARGDFAPVVRAPVLASGENTDEKNLRG